MSKKLYGLLDNRLEEGHNFTGRELQTGDDITMYLWSDRACYYITDVIDQKRIKVKRYNVCADHSKPGGMGHQDWMYFKSLREMHEYLGIGFWTDEEYEQADREETWVFRYGKWMREHLITEMKYPDAYSKREREQFAKKGWCFTYSELSGGVSFGVRDYHYDWEF